MKEGVYPFQIRNDIYYNKENTKSIIKDFLIFGTN